MVKILRLTSNFVFVGAASSSFLHMKRKKEEAEGRSERGAFDVFDDER